MHHSAAELLSVQRSSNVHNVRETIFVDELDTIMQRARRCTIMEVLRVKAVVYSTAYVSKKNSEVLPS